MMSLSLKCLSFILEIYLSYSNYSKDISFAHGQVLVGRSRKVVPGYTLGAGRPDRLERGMGI